MGSVQTRAILDRHVGHALTIIDRNTLRCFDCSHRLLLDDRREGRELLDQGAPDVAPVARCHVHRGQPAQHCRGCAADRKAADRTPRPTTQPTADVVTGVAACRAALARAREQQA